MLPAKFGTCLVRAFLSLLLLGCTPDASLKTVDVGPRIVLDTTELNKERKDRAALKKELDSLARDTSAKAKREIAFFDVVRMSQLISTQETLARLGYGVRFTGILDTPTKNAIRDFEHYHGITDTGDFDAPELALAIRHVDEITTNQFGLKSLSVWTSSWAQSAHAVGTWRGADPPRQTSEIWCYRSLGTCHEEYSYLLSGQLYVGSTDFQVENWNNDELRARFDAGCVSDVLSINRASEAVILVRSSRNQQLTICRELRQRTDDIAMQLVDGHIVADSLYKIAIPYYRRGNAVTKLYAYIDSVNSANKK